MANGIKNKIGTWRYADGAIAEKSFGGRLFKIVIAGAADHGIVGPESNGIVILDEDYSQVVLTNHAQESSGYDGPSQRQVAEFKKILAMDWREFTSFVRQHPYYREGSIPDINEPAPRKSEPVVDRIIFPESVKNPECPYEFPLQSHREIVEFLCNHPMHRLDNSYSPFVLAWDIKVRSFDTSGKAEGFEPDPDFDERWQEYLEENGELFWTIAADETSQFTENGYSTYDGNDEGQYEFGTTGRSGGWLVLTKVKGLGELKWINQADMRIDLKGWADSDLVRLYKLVAQVDKDVADPEAAMAHAYASHREMMEDIWKAELRNIPPSK